MNAMTDITTLINELRSNAAVYKGFLEADGIRLTRGIALQARAADALEALTARAEAAEAERDEIGWRLSCLLDELTDGRMSKTGYDVRTMVQEIEATFDKCAQEDRAEVEAERDALRARIAEALDVIEGGDLYEVCACDRISHILSADAPTVPAPELEREDDAPSGVAGHDEQCEAEYLAEATGWLPCGCADRAAEENNRDRRP